MRTEEAIYNRTSLLVGDEVMNALSKTRVIVFGVGGVGSWCAEGLVRSGIINLTIVDSDIVNISNVNRQSMATTRTIGQVKVNALKERLLDINPEACITAVQETYSEETARSFNLDSYDYVIDAIDSLKDKASLILLASASRAKLFCAMGAALKIDPTKVKVAEFWDVRGCPLAAAIRKKFRRNKTLPSQKILCVYDEEVLPNLGETISVDTDNSLYHKAQINGTLVHITAIFGFTLSGLVIQDIYNAYLRTSRPMQ